VTEGGRERGKVCASILSLSLSLTHTQTNSLFLSLSLARSLSSHKPAQRATHTTAPQTHCHSPQPPTHRDPPPTTQYLFRKFHPPPSPTHPHTRLPPRADGSEGLACPCLFWRASPATTNQPPGATVECPAPTKQNTYNTHY